MLTVSECLPADQHFVFQEKEKPRGTQVEKKG